LIHSHIGILLEWPCGIFQEYLFGMLIHVEYSNHVPYKWIFHINIGIISMTYKWNNIHDNNIIGIFMA
jgi:hypothetical protein